VTVSQENPLDKAKDHARDADAALDKVARDIAFADEIEAVSTRRAGLVKLGGRARAGAHPRLGVGAAPGSRRTPSSARPAPAPRPRSPPPRKSATSRFRGALDQLRGQLTRTAVTAGNVTALDRLEESAKDLQRSVDAEQERLKAVAKPFTDAYDALEREVKDAHKHLDRFGSARFQLQAGENPYRTSECTWQDFSQGAVNGFLYLTDKRVRFEQKETVTTKKFLFFTASSEDKHELLLDEPVGNIARSDDSTKGLVFKDQLVTLTWQNARVQKSTFDINSGETAKDWDTWIEELRSGQLAHRMKKAGEGAVAPPPTLGMPVDAPTKCSACDASLDAPVRGMTVLMCKYCGQRHDLKFA
jgi:hypothetical protein